MPMTQLRPDPTRTGTGWLRRVPYVGAAAGLALAVAGGVAVHAQARPRAQTVYACSTAPATVMDDCAVAATYATANDGGASTALTAEADTERHGGTIAIAVWDIRVQTPTGIFVEHVSRQETGSGIGTVLWQSRAENQNPPAAEPTPSPTSGATDANGGDHGSDPGTDHGGGDRSPERQPAQNQPGTTLVPQLSATAADSVATTWVTLHTSGATVTVRNTKTKSNDGKDYYTVKLRIAASTGGEGNGVTVWVDATTSSGTVTAVRGDGLAYSLPTSSLTTPAAADTAALAAVSASTMATPAQLQGEKWPVYQVRVRTASGAGDKVWVSAASGVITQVRAAG